MIWMDTVQKSQRNQKPAPHHHDKRFPGKPIVEGIGSTKIYYINNEVVIAAQKDVLQDMRRILPSTKKYAVDILCTTVSIVEWIKGMTHLSTKQIGDLMRLAKNTQKRQILAEHVESLMSEAGAAKYLENDTKEKLMHCCEDIKNAIRLAENVKFAENVEYMQHIAKNYDGVLTDALITDALIGNIMNRLTIKKIMTELGIKAEETYIDDNNIVICSRGARQGAGGCDSIISQSTTDLGFTPISAADITAALACYIKYENICLPVGNKNKYKRKELVLGILKNLQLEKRSDELIISIIDHTGAPIFYSCNLKVDDATKRLMDQLTDDQMIFGCCMDYLSKRISKESGWAVLTESLPRVRTDEARILIKKAADQFSSGALRTIDTSIEIGADTEDFASKVIEKVAIHSKLVKRKEELADLLKSGTLKTEPQFTLQNWPTHPLLQHIKKQLVPLIDQIVLGSDVDSQDLKYQTLFRLTTCKIEDIFDDGAKLQSQLETAGVFSNWKAILLLKPEIIEQYPLNKTNVKALIGEQLLICKERAKNSSLPLDTILGRKGIFSKEGLQIKVEGEKIYAFDTENKVELEFREIETDLAIQYHGDLHYIHTPRAKMAFGMFEKGSSNPFSILAYDSVDRPYKQNVLLLHGYDPQNSLDLTRLYNWPGCPKNASSSMFSLSMRYLKEKRPETQALLSSFMPSYTNGISMTSGGFDNPVLIKPTKHVFVRRIIDGKIAWEHLTKRRLGNSETGTELESSMPLLPTIELMATLQPPRFEPAAELTGKMVSILNA